MKWRSLASLPPRLTGHSQRTISTAASAKLKHGSYPDRLQSQDISSLRQSLQSSIVEEDDFSELGPVSPKVHKLLHLLTEKPKPYLKTEPVRRNVSERSVHPENSSRVMNIVHNQRSSTSAAHRRMDKCNHHYGYPVGSKDTSNLSNPRTVSVQRVPHSIELPQLMEALAVFGKITSGFVRDVSTGSKSCNIEFETVESRNRAVAAGGIAMKSSHLPISALHVPDTAMIRIENINVETSDAVIHVICSSVGALEGLAKLRENAVDVVYRVRDNADMKIILKKLNDTSVDGSQWSADFSPTDPTPDVMPESEDSRQKLGLEISSHLAEMKKQAGLMVIDIEDLEQLHSDLMKLEKATSVCNPCS